MCHGLKFLGARSLRFGFLDEDRGGLAAFLLAVCVEAATTMTGASRKDIEVDYSLAYNEDDQRVNQIEREVRALEHTWRVTSVALSRLPGTCTVDLKTSISFI